MFCFSPWTFLQILPSGKLNACCFSSTGQIQDNDGNVITIKEYPTVDRILNSSTYQTMRKSLTEGRFPVECTVCKNIEATKGTSPRNALNSGIAPYINQQELIEQTDGRGFLESPRIRYLELRLGNTCNLRCRICGPHNSTNWYADHEKLQSSNPELMLPPLAKVTSEESQPWYSSNEFLSWFDVATESLLNLQFAGGEPLVNTVHNKIIDRLIENKSAKNINLIYTTNATISPQPFFSKWAQFKSVIIFLSLDGIKSSFEYQRWPAKWPAVEKNIETFESQLGQSVTKLFIQPTVSIYNIANIYELAEWFAARNSDIQWIKHVHFLTEPNYLSPFILTAQQKKSALEKIKADHKIFAAKFNNSKKYDQVYKWVESVCDLFATADWSEKKNDFSKFNTSLDSIRGINYEHYLDPLTVSFLR